MFSTKDPAEIITLTFDFSALTTSISTAAVVVESISGTNDPTPSAILNGAAQISGGKILQQVINGVSGTYYLIKATATATDGSKYVLNDTLPVLTA